MFTEELSLGLMLTESGILDLVIEELLILPQLLLFTEKNKGAKKLLTKRVEDWREELTQELESIELSPEFKSEIDSFQAACELSEQQFSEQMADIVGGLEGKSGFYLAAREYLENSQDKPARMQYRQFMQMWRQYLIDNLTQAQHEEIAVHREKLLAEIYQRMEMSETIDEITPMENSELSAPLWDMSDIKLHKDELKTLEQSANTLRKHPKLVEMAESMGRMAQQSSEPENHSTVSEQTEIIQQKRDDVPDDIVGIYPHDDISRMLPNEVIYLAYPELEVVFYKQLLDKKLMNYQYQGIEEQHVKRKYYHNESSEKLQPKGPFLVCLDASGSMQGTPEQYAKAMTLAFMQIAMAQGRECTVLMFSKDYVTYDLAGKTGLRDIVDFLSYSFHGGTDLEPVLAKALSMMKSGKFENADLVVISDFIAPRQPQKLLDEINNIKQRDNRFHAIALSQHANPKVMKIFDHIWDYVPTVGLNSVKSWFGKRFK
ncbi:ATPase RavA stimulator ViaA [Vibrio sp. SS-MA-C1-2]|uniref:ATPase RavA stimulator ViaA n=1 Tax=Vibrio sp. SS-MA-C1-2 TaxID=2908646 RepID=UPI001F340959|nr:ATPase RavA stimulator ViaA [Vibrio sp. SS-MA-C1-2]UJF17534.1 ATPase RavA stimulator ViaA [Vibrio sp. SS-MA-C1-2]